jgi:DNA-3-methyladenine glycosylase II
VIQHAAIMTEHLAWRDAGDSLKRRVFASDTGTASLVEVTGSQAMVRDLTPAGTPDLALDTFTWSDDQPLDAAQLQATLVELGPVARHRNPSLWGAIGTAIIRQVIRAPQAKKLYGKFCDECGPQFSDGANIVAGFPSPEDVLGLDSEQFKAIGMAFKEKPLRSAAAAFLDSGDAWKQMQPTDLVASLLEVKGIGNWTAQVATADWTNDWSVYPHGDLAVRTWSGRAAPDHQWPGDEKTFEQTWRTMAGGNVGAATLLTFAWGSQHGIIS